MTTVVNSQQGDTVDLICHRHGGTSDDVVAVYALNSGMCIHGPVLPLGTRVTLPDFSTTTSEQTNDTMLQLWD